MRLLVAVLGGAATGTLALLSIWAFARRQARLERHLAGYEPVTASRTSLKPSDVDLSPESKVVAQAMELTRDIAARTGALARTELLLEQADVPIRPAEFLFYVPVGAVLLGAIVGVGFNPLTGLVAAALAALIPFGVVMRKRDVRLKAFDNQLPDALNLLASSMRAGFSFMQGLEAVANEAANPLQREFQRVFTETRLGRSVDAALEDCAIRMKNQDLQWVVLALRIQREVGGNMAQLLMTVAETMTQRERLRREVRALTAEGRFSAVVLSIMPFFFLAVFQVLEPDYVPQLFKKTLGVLALVAAGIGNVVGWVWLRRIVDIEV